METAGETSTVRQLRQKLNCTKPDTFEMVLANFPAETLDAVLERVLAGTKLEVALYTDIFNQNQFKYSTKYDVAGPLTEAPVEVTLASLRSMHAIILTSDLVDDIDACGWYGWDAVTYTLLDALCALPKNVVELDEMDTHRLRSAVLVNILKDRSFRPNYSELVDYFEQHHNEIRACLPALAERHEELSEIDLGIVEEFISGVPVAIVEGVL